LPTHHISSGIALELGFIGLWGFVFTESFGFKKPKRGAFQVWSARIFLVPLTAVVVGGIFSLIVRPY